MPTGETLAVETPSPVPPPPPTPTATASTHRRHRTFSSSSSSSLSTVSSAASSPSQSPRGRRTTTTITTTSVPFSWEHHPGIPKTRLRAGGAGTAGTPSSAPTPLPLPPPLRAPTTSKPRYHHHARRRRLSSKPPADAAVDPFAAALAECTRERAAGAGSDAGLMDELFPVRASPAPTSRRWSIASAGGVVGLLDLYGCKGAMCVAESAFVVRRPVAVVRAGPGRAGRR